MVFQPTSPIRHFQLIAPRAYQRKDSNPQQPTTTVARRLSAVLDKMHLNKGSSQHKATTTPGIDSIMSLESSPMAETRSIPDVVDPEAPITPLAQSPIVNESSEDRSSTDLVSDRGTTNSSPTDPAYILSESRIRVVSARSPRTPRNNLAKAVEQNNGRTQSYFDSDTGSEDDEPVVGRASSVRMSKPIIVAGTSSLQGQRVHPYGVTLDVGDRPASPAVSQVSSLTESGATIDGATEQEQKPSGPAEALAILEGRIFEKDPALKSASETVRSPGSLFSGSTDRSRSGGLFMNPVTDGDRTSIQRAISAPPLPQRHPSHKKVRIRPSDLVIVHSDDSVRHFREKIVTTPYPVITEEDNANDYQTRQDEKLTALAPRSSLMKSAGTDSDRFPSPARSEILFLSLGLANHPSAITSLEIRIANKDVYDDEMLFRQIRTAYRSRLLGMSRFPFCFIRGVTHATTSASVQHDFKTSEFMKHFDDPRIGRKRKTWVIWLRHHSRQQTPISGDRSVIAHRPVSASLRTADKRLSAHSDSSSTLNFSFLPPLAIPRIPFFSKGSTASGTASAHRPYSPSGAENGSGVIQIDLHHEFSYWLLAFLYGCVVFMSIAAVVLWTIFGLPGTRPGSNVAGSPASTMVDRLAWTTAAQTRVLTALVLGMMVALLGSMMEICLIAGAYILL